MIALSGALVEAISDLAGWFGSRGVETITFVEGRDGDVGDGPVVPGPPEGGGEGDCSAKWTREAETVLELISVPGPDQGMAHMQRVAPGAALAVSTPGGQPRQRSPPTE